MFVAIVRKESVAGDILMLCGSVCRLSFFVNEEEEVLLHSYKSFCYASSCNPVICFVFQWGSAVYLCYKKSVAKTNTISYKAGM